MIVNILNHANEARFVDVGDIETVRRMFIGVMNGDESLYVQYKDGKGVCFDSSNDSDRIERYLDIMYDIYNVDDDLNLLESGSFLNRNNSYC